MRCPACDADNPDLARFCASCGERLAVGCPHCGSSVALGARFCTSCGGTMPVAGEAPGGEARRAAGAERRRVSVLFADLENFTGLAESLDPEEVRAIQSRYFEVARATVAVYGGIIEKFIGDAVVAMWGAPTAHEDDAERAIRAGLDLVASVGRLVDAGGGARLAARAAVATGEAAVSVADGQGMVSGDVINTAARLQGSAPSGGVIVDQATRHAAGPDGAIGFAPVGPLVLKGKSAPVAAFVTSLGERARSGRGAGHAGAFVGRQAELRELVGLFEATAHEGRGRMASVLGIAGIGKSRLAWELERAVVDRSPRVEWQTGGAPAYGDGIAFAAVGEMVRRRCRIAEHAEGEVARRQLDTALAELVRDPDDRAWIAPRLAVLLEPRTAASFEREELFAAWRRFFERLAADAPTVLVFEDLQWADAGLLDFIEHLGTWARDHPILVLTLARPELLDARPAWGAAQRSFTSLRLDRLPDAAMRELLDARAHGIPRPALRHILDRAGGVPLYAVELTRMLIDRGQLVTSERGYRLAGPLTGADLPDSLHGLLAARIDALPPGERALLRRSAVLGRRFSTDALAAVTGLGGAELRRRVAALVDRELLAYDDELHSPASSQLAFVQDLVRELAYRTLSRSERLSAHLAAARHFEAVGDEELVESTAAHLAAAFAANPAHPEAAGVATRARELLRQAARRALALHAPERALEGLERALAMPANPEERAALLEEAATAARRAGRLSVAERYLRELIERAGADERDRLRAQLASVLLMSHQNAAALAELEAAVAPDGVDATPATVELIGQLARANLLVGRDRDAVRWAERAVELAGHHGQTAVAVDARITLGTARFRSGDEATGLEDLRAAVAEAQAGGLQTAELRARNNLAWLEVVDDPRRTLEIAREGGEVALRIGMLDWAVQMAELGCLAAIETGDWDWALETQARFDERPISAAYRLDLAASAATIRALRGSPDPLEPIEALAPIDPATDPQDLAAADLARGWAALVAGDGSGAVGHAERAAERALGAERLRALVLAAHARLWQRDLDGLRATAAAVEAMPSTGRAVGAARATLAAGIAALAGGNGAAQRYADAARAWRDLELPLHLALCLLEWHRFAEGDTLAEAEAVLERLGARGLRSLVESPVVS
ncbi:MAG TPA: AAA family ATPase [Candidatus Limnocylindria bacterium]|nr:AAA family ATPase [Candidatus Limnocylindria bacterium]